MRNIFALVSVKCYYVVVGTYEKERYYTFEKAHIWQLREFYDSVDVSTLISNFYITGLDNLLIVFDF